MRNKVQEAYDQLLRAIAEEESSIMTSEVNTLYEQYKGKKKIGDVFVAKKRLTLLEIFNIVNDTAYDTIDQAEAHLSKEKEKLLGDLVNISDPSQLKKAIYEVLSEEESLSERQKLLEILKKL